MSIMFEDVLLKQNIHWAGEEYPYGIERRIKSDVEKFLSTKYIQIITGPRRAGKTYLLYQMMNTLLESIEPRNIMYANLDAPSYTPLNEGKDGLADVYEDFLKLKNPDGRKYLFLDEIQSIGEWEKWVKSVYDSQEDVKFFLTGSNASLLTSELSRLLSGRDVHFIVFPFDFQEFLKAKGMVLDDVEDIYQSYYPKRGALRHHLMDLLENGSFPETVFLDEGLKDTILERYYETMIYRDVVPRVRNPDEIEELAYYLATNISNQITYNSISKSLDLSPTSVKRYLDLFEKAYLFFTVNKFSFSVKKQVKSPKKVYCIDPGIRNVSGFKFSKDAGRIAENLVFLDLRRRGKDVYYWKGKQEVDFVVREKNEVELLIQSSWDVGDEKTRQREVDGLIEGLEEFGLEEGVIITENHHSEEEISGKKIRFVPLWTWLLRKS